MNTILPGHTYDIEGVGSAVIDEIRSINGEARIKALPLAAGDVPVVERAGNAELAACPFCGEKDELYPGYRGMGAGKPYQIDCVGCGIEFTPREGMDVVAAWNRRIASPPSPVGADDGLVERPETKGPYEARVCKGIPSDCCDYGVVSLSEGLEVCRVWREQDARAIATALASAPQPAKDGWREALEKSRDVLRNALANKRLLGPLYSHANTAVHMINDALDGTPTEQAAPAGDSGCRCRGCHLIYRADLIVPDVVWEKISPIPVEGDKGGGLLCPSCIMGRIVEAGIWTAGRADGIGVGQAAPAVGVEGITRPECPYCGATDGLRVKCDGGGYIAPEYTCERCFTAEDTGPSFDDLPLAPVVLQFINEHAREVKITIEGPNSLSENTLTEMEARHLRNALTDAIPLTPAEKQSGVTRVQWAENLIRQLPEDHDGRNSWLLNYGTGPKPSRCESKIAWK